MARTLPDGTVDPTPRRAYAALDGRTLLVRAMRLPLPRHGIQVTGEMVPYVTRVAPGDSATDRVRLRTPGVVDDAYRQMELTAALADSEPTITGGAARQADVVALTVGVFRVEPPVTLGPAASWPRAARVYAAYPPVFGQMLLTRRLRMPGPISVLDHEAVRRYD